MIWVLNASAPNKSKGKWDTIKLHYNIQGVNYPATLASHTNTSHMHSPLRLNQAATAATRGRIVRSKMGRFRQPARADQNTFRRIMGMAGQFHTLHTLTGHTSSGSLLIISAIVGRSIGSRFQQSASIKASSGKEHSLGSSIPSRFATRSQISKARIPSYGTFRVST